MAASISPSSANRRQEMPRASNPRKRATLSAKEQSGVAQAARETRAPFLPLRIAPMKPRSATFSSSAPAGKSSEEIQQELQRRLGNDRETELRTAAEEQRKITRLRLEKLLAS